MLYKPRTQVPVFEPGLLIAGVARLRSVPCPRGILLVYVLPLSPSSCYDARIEQK